MAVLGNWYCVLATQHSGLCWTQRVEITTGTLYRHPVGFCRDYNYTPRVARTAEPVIAFCSFC